MTRIRARNSKLVSLGQGPGRLQSRAPLDRRASCLRIQHLGLLRPLRAVKDSDWRPLQLDSSCRKSYALRLERRKVPCATVSSLSLSLVRMGQAGLLGGIVAREDGGMTRSTARTGRRMSSGSWRYRGPVCCDGPTIWPRTDPIRNGALVLFATTIARLSHSLAARLPCMHKQPSAVGKVCCLTLLVFEGLGRARPTTIHALGLQHRGKLADCWSVSIHGNGLRNKPPIHF
jgi:hypothetical protein